MVVFVIILEVIRQIADPLGQDSNLNFRAARIAFGLGIVFDNLGFFFGSYRHVYSLLLSDIG